MRSICLVCRRAAFAAALILSAHTRAAEPGPVITVNERQVVTEWQVRPTPGQQSRRSSNAGLPSGYWKDNRINSSFFVRSDLPFSIAGDLSATIMQDRRRARDEALLQLSFAAGSGGSNGMSIPRAWFDAGRRLYIGRLKHPSRNFWDDVVSGVGVNSFSIDLHAARTVRRRAVPLASAPGSGRSAAWRIDADGSSTLISTAGEFVRFNAGRMNDGRGGATYFDSPVGPGVVSVSLRSTVTFEPVTIDLIPWRPELVVVVDTPSGRVRRATTLEGMAIPDTGLAPFEEVKLEVEVPAGKTVRITLSAAHLTVVGERAERRPSSEIRAKFTPADPGGGDPDGPDEPDPGPSDPDPGQPAVGPGDCIAIAGMFKQFPGLSLSSLVDAEGGSPVVELSRSGQRACVSATASAAGVLLVTGGATPRTQPAPHPVLIDIYINDAFRGTFASARMASTEVAIARGDRIRLLGALDPPNAAGPFPMLLQVYGQLRPN